ncbi:hypothetical protein QTP88_021077 [Uroleucon formosanum]
MPNTKPWEKRMQLFLGEKRKLFYHTCSKRGRSFLENGEKNSMIAKEFGTSSKGNMTGTDERKLLVIGKSKSPRCFKGVSSLPVVYKNITKAWDLSFCDVSTNTTQLQADSGLINDINKDYSCRYFTNSPFGKLLDNFVKTFEMLYGRNLISHNVYVLSHICDDYIKFGSLDNYSTFPFENYMSTLKNMIWKPDNPLIQVVKRSNEISLLIINCQKEIPMFTFSGVHKHGPLIQNIQGSQYTTLKMKTFSIKLNTEADSFLLTYNGDIIKVFNIVKD